MINKKVALITGANRGIGLEVCKQLCQQGHIVVLGSRNDKMGEFACQKLLELKLKVHFRQLDITKFNKVKEVVKDIQHEFGKLDILVNNAAIVDMEYSILDIDLGIFRQVLETNLLGSLYLSQQCIPMMKKNNYGRIVNVSSGRGSFSRLCEGKSGGPAYRISKTALNALTCLLAEEVKNDNILVNAVTPGWVKTRMGGNEAPRSVQEGAETIVWLANLPNDGPRGCFFKDKKVFPW